MSNCNQRMKKKKRILINNSSFTHLQRNWKIKLPLRNFIHKRSRIIIKKQKKIFKIQLVISKICKMMKKVKFCRHNYTIRKLFLVMAKHKYISLKAFNNLIRRKNLLWWIQTLESNLNVSCPLHWCLQWLMSKKKLSRLKKVNKENKVKISNKNRWKRIKSNLI